MIIVSLTSWKKRIHNVCDTIKSVLNQSVVPDCVELNLSLDEFPNKEADLPLNVVDFLSKNSDKVHVNYVIGNTRAFKKLIPTLKKYAGGETHYILTVDDDVVYRNDYVEMMVNYIKTYNGDSFCLANCHVCGNRMIYKSTAFDEQFFNKLTDEIISYSIDDAYIQHYLLSTKKRVTHFRPDDVKDIIRINIEIYPLHDEYTKDDRVKKALNAIEKVKFK